MYHPELSAIVKNTTHVVERGKNGRIVDNFKTFKGHLSEIESNGGGRPLSSVAQFFGWLTHNAFQDHKVATGNSLECYDKDGKLLAKAKWVLVNPGTFDDKRCVKVLYPQEIGM
jgi:hypothetical protein